MSVIPAAFDLGVVLALCAFVITSTSAVVLKVVKVVGRRRIDLDQIAASHARIRNRIASVRRSMRDNAVEVSSSEHDEVDDLLEHA